MKLERFCYAPAGTFGRLLGHEFMCYTVERPWLNNARYISCIPEGTYELSPTTFFRGGYRTYEIMDVPGRSLIKIHKANTPHDVLGCIGVGMTLGAWPNGAWAVLDSTTAFLAFMDAVKRETEPAMLEIVQYRP